MNQKLEQAIALIESAMADITHKNDVNNMILRQLKAGDESIKLAIYNINLFTKTNHERET